MKITRALLILYLCGLPYLGLYSQPMGLKGSVRNASGHPVSGAIIQSSDLDSLIYTDSLGNFSLLPNGQKHYIKVIAPHYIPRSIVLPFNYNERLLIYLDSIDGDRDFNPYEIIRLARLRRRENERRYTAFEAMAYKSTSVELERVPFNLWLFSGWMAPAKKDTGLMFFSEQLSRQEYIDNHHLADSVVHFAAGGTLPAPDFSYVSDKYLSLYREKITLPELSFSRYHTPFSEKSLRMYNFTPLGSYMDEGQKVFRIGFRPKRHGSPALTGYLHIYDSTYTIAYTHFTIKASSQLESLDSIQVEQFYHYGKEGYTQAFQKMGFYLNINGFRGSYSTHTEYLQHHFKEKPPSPSPLAEVYHIDSSAVTEDSRLFRHKRTKALSSRERGLLLTENLNELFRERYSRVPDLQKTFSPIELTYKRYVYRTDEHYLYFKPLYNALGYNTVEGLYLRYDVPIELYGDDHEWMLKPEARMGFADGDFKSRVTAELTYDLSNPKKVQLEVGHVVDQFNEDDPISPFINSLYTLFFSRNYLKLYGKDYIQGGYKLEITNGLEMQSSLEYASRFPVYNHTDFVVTGTAQKFTPNNPEFGDDISSKGFEDHQALTFRIQLAYQFDQLYKSINGKKVNLKMNTPRVYLNYRQGIETGISQTHYSFLAGGITFNTPLGNIGYTRWDLSGGGFFDAKRIEFIDYKHFNGTQTFYLQPAEYYFHPIKQFSTLGYYEYSTKKAFAEAHLEHHFNGFLLSKVGILRRTQAHTYLGANYLHNFTKQQFLELFIGFDNIHNIMRMEIAAGWDNFIKLRPTFLVGLEFDLLYYAQNHKK